MNAETRARIFEPFFTTKKPGEGTGMGLATVQHIVSEAGGWIQVATAPQCGTRIEVLLPAFAVIAKTQVLDSPILEVSNRKGGSRC
jgi:C4-dicarboxylate-specific signal transduction histidine kinase